MEISWNDRVKNEVSSTVKKEWYIFHR